MATFSATSMSEFNQSAATAINEVSKGQINPFNMLNKLNKLAQKNDYCDGLVVRPIVDAFRAYCEEAGIAYNKRYAFSLDVFNKDRFGRFCYAKSVRRHNGVNDELFEDNYMQPVSFVSEPSLLRAIVAVVRPYIKEQIEAAKEAEREAKKAAKEAAKSAKESEKALKKAQNEVKKMRAFLVKEYNAGRIGEAEFFTRMQTLKVA